MPAFIRTNAAKSAPPPLGTRSSAYNAGLLCSTGVASLDEVLGGGLPVGSLLLVEQDEQSPYADLLLHLFASQGLSCDGHHIAILASPLDASGGPEGFLAKLPAPEAATDGKSRSKDSDEDVPASKDPMKIAFRYQQMKQTDVPKAAAPASETYCSMFDMTSHRTVTPTERERVHLFDVSPTACMQEALSSLDHIVETQKFTPRPSAKEPQGILRIAIQGYASPFWPQQSSHDICRFLLSLRHLLRTSLACAIMTIPAALIRSASTGGHTLLRRIEHLADAVIELQSFASRPDLAALFPRYAGLVHVRTLPALSTLVPPSARLSVLRGTSGKEDLAFRLKRRRFVIETLHLDVDGGVNERRTPKKNEEDKGAKAAPLSARNVDF